ncbi:MAG TPA: erythromycin esterase family protein [Candidatus Limnocylindrales bacterium]|nr:erythromycin esterase family protein [Candidatus Limnocylindrales bacterium]
MEQIKMMQNLMRALGSAADFDELISNIGNSRVVMLGEASHGTHEFYYWRSELTKRLVAEKGFSFVAVEGDWPDCYRYNRYVKGYDNTSKTAEEIADTYRRWPRWMWANAETAEFLDWLRNYNDEKAEPDKVGFYGLDVYSLWDSINAATDYIQKNHPESLDQAREAYKCFEPYKEDPIGYAYGGRGLPHSCQDEVVNMLVGLIQAQTAGEHDPEEHFNAEQNAMVAINAERYYKSMLGGQAESWNVRDHHMMGTLQRLMERYGKDAKAIIWAHNTHIGDARATDMADAGMINIGQLVREFYKDKSYAVGFGTYQGTVIAADAWDTAAEIIEVPPARPESWDGLFHQTVGSDGYLMLRRLPKVAAAQRTQRAIGVVYHPDREQYGNYVPTSLAERYDAYIHIDTTTALNPLSPERADNEVPETYPTGV